jgi:DNA-binding transcriptional ArsR family regulator
MDEIFKAMADGSRRRILAALCREPREAGELARLVGLAPNAVSFHLKALKSADLVSVRRDGRFLRYSVAPESVRSWRSHVDDLFPAMLLETAGAPVGTDGDAAGLAIRDAGGGAQLPTELL